MIAQQKSLAHSAISGQAPHSVVVSRTQSSMPAAAPRELVRKTIVFVVNWLDVGGAEIQVVRLAGGMHQRGWNVSVVSLLPAGPLSVGLRKQGITVHSLN